MTSLPKEAPPEVRAMVLEALKDPDGYFIYPDGRRYLKALDLDPKGVVVDLIGYLDEGSRLYVLPENPSKCQCCLDYGERLVVHVKISPQAARVGVLVALAFHRHNTGYAPLPP